MGIEIRNGNGNPEWQKVSGMGKAMESGKGIGIQNGNGYVNPKWV